MNIEQLNSIPTDVLKDSLKETFKELILSNPEAMNKLFKDLIDTNFIHELYSIETINSVSTYDSKSKSILHDIIRDIVTDEVDLSKISNDLIGEELDSMDIDSRVSDRIDDQDIDSLVDDRIDDQDIEYKVSDRIDTYLKEEVNRMDITALTKDVIEDKLNDISFKELVENIIKTQLNK